MFPFALRQRTVERDRPRRARSPQPVAEIGSGAAGSSAGSNWRKLASPHPPKHLPDSADRLPCALRGGCRAGCSSFSRSTAPVPARHQVPSIPSRETHERDPERLQFFEKHDQVRRSRPGPIEPRDQSASNRRRRASFKNWSSAGRSFRTAYAAVAECRSSVSLRSPCFLAQPQCRIRPSPARVALLGKFVNAFTAPPLLRTEPRSLTKSIFGVRDYRDYAELHAD
jgi:hypothetical protein